MCLSAELPLDGRARSRQRLVQLRRVLAAGLGHVVTAAAPAADDRGDLADDRAGREAALDRVLGDEGNQAGLVAELAAEDDDRGLVDLRLHPVGEVEELLRGRLQIFLN